MDLIYNLLQIKKRVIQKFLIITLVFQSSQFHDTDTDSLPSPKYESIATALEFKDRPHKFLWF